MAAAKSRLMPKLFISHSARDEPIVEAFVELLHCALKLNASDIRCTTLDGHRLPGGTDTDEQLRAEVYNSPAFVGIISSSSVKSLYVAFELGARWGIRKHLMPVLAPGESTNLLGGPLKGINALRLDSAAQIHQIIRDLSAVLKVRPQPPEAYQKYIDVILSLPLPSKAQLELTQGASKNADASTQEQLKHYFLIGCGVGNKIAMLPLPQNSKEQGSDEDGFAEFLDYLTSAGLSGNQVFQTLQRSKGIGELSDDHKDKVKSLIEEYFEAMNALPRIMRDNGTDREFAWFSLGKLIYDIPTYLALDNEEDSVKPLLTALEMLLDDFQFPPALEKKLRKYIKSGRERPDAREMMERANLISRAVYAFL